MFVRRALIAIALAAVAVLAWQLRTVLVLLFGAVVLATVVRALADPLSKHLRLPERVAVLIAVLLIVGVIAGVALAARPADRRAGQRADKHFAGGARRESTNGSRGFGLGHPFQTWLAQLHHNGGTLVSRFGGWLSAASSGLANFLIVLFGGIFLATEPRFYRTGAIKLVPEARRDDRRSDGRVQRALRMWLKGQLMAMLIIGLMTGTGLWLFGVQSWLVLGILAGFFEFIPFAGPILSAIPAILIALVQSPQLALWTTAHVHLRPA